MQDITKRRLVLWLAIAAIGASVTLLGFGRFSGLALGAILGVLSFPWIMGAAQFGPFPFHRAFFPQGWRFIFKAVRSESKLVKFRGVINVGLHGLCAGGLGAMIVRWF